jgi:hypothetical protein
MPIASVSLSMMDARPVRLAADQGQDCPLSAQCPVRVTSSLASSPRSLSTPLSFVREMVSHKAACWRPMRATLTAYRLPAQRGEFPNSHNNPENADIFGAAITGC